MASTYLTRTTGTPTNAKKWTISFWVKISGKRADAEDVVYVGVDASNEVLLHRYETDGTVSTKEDTSAQNTIWRYGNQNRLFRDTHAWQHWVYAFDSTLGTGNDRLKVYVNGVERRTIETLTNDVTVPLNHEAIINKSGYIFTFGRRTYNTDNYFTGLLSHVHFIDGIQYDASTFGETDSTTGEWKIITNPTISDYGNNGFFILKDGNSVTDQSGKGNNFTANGTLTKTEDCPSNVFATFNPLITSNTFSGNFSNANTTIATSTSAKGVMLSTLGASTGKYYFEMKHTNTDDIGVGIADQAISLNTWSPSTGNYVFFLQNGEVRRPSGSTSSGTTFTQNDIIGVAWNATDAEVTFYKNGTAVNSGTAYSVEGTQGTMFFAVADTGTGSDPTASFNFGNGYFGTTAVASAGTNASNNGIFEYDVPTGFTALSTKGLNL